MKIAITSQNKRTVSGHAGRATRFVVFEVENGAVVEKSLIEVDEENTLHEFFHNARIPGKLHPVLEADVIITAGMGPGFTRHMDEFGIEAVMTDEMEVDKVVEKYINGSLNRIQPNAHQHNHNHHH